MVVTPKMFKNYIKFVNILLLVPVYCETQSERQQIQSYTSCRTDKECQKNSFCFGNDDNQQGKCKCLDGFELDRNETSYRCLKAVKIGETCEDEIQCFGSGGLYSTCLDGKCQCLENGILTSEGICTFKSILGEVCMNSDSCKWIKYAGCSEGKCKCASNLKPSPDNTKCLFNSTLGEICNEDEDCNSESLRCSDGCRCRPEYITSRNNSICLPAALKIGEPCIEDAQCSKFLENTICVNNTCLCKGNTQQIGNECFSLTRNCTSSTDCITNQYRKEVVICKNNLCKYCQNGKTKDGLSCNLDPNSSGFIVGSLKILIIMFLFLFIF